jgi:transcriptional regulator with XRE-family HTH domain
MSISSPELPKDLRAAIEAAGLNQHRLSVATGINAATISRYCNGLRPTNRHAAILAEALRARQGESS